MRETLRLANVIRKVLPLSKPKAIRRRCAPDQSVDAHSNRLKEISQTQC